MVRFQEHLSIHPGGNRWTYRYPYQRDAPNDAHVATVLVLQRTLTATALTLQRCDSFKEVLSRTVLAQGVPQSGRCQ